MGLVQEILLRNQQRRSRLRGQLKLHAERPWLETLEARCLLSGQALAPAAAADIGKISTVYAQLPLSFVPNSGQFAPPALLRRRFAVVRASGNARPAGVAESTGPSPLVAPRRRSGIADRMFALGSLRPRARGDGAADLGRRPDRGRDARCDHLHRPAHRADLRLAAARRLQRHVLHGQRGQDLERAASPLQWSRCHRRRMQRSCAYSIRGG